MLLKLLWLAGVFLVFALFLVFMTAAPPFGGGTWTPAFLALPAAILLAGILWGTFHRVFPDRWP